MRINGFVEGSYLSSNPGLAAQDVINLYPEFVPGNDKAKIVLRGTPGVNLFAELADVEGPIRCIYSTVENRAFAVKANTLLEFFSNGTSVVRGTIETYFGAVEIADNGEAAVLAGNQLCIVDGSKGYIYDLIADTLTEITDGDFPSNPTHVKFASTYFIVTEGGTNRIHISEPFDGLTWDANFGTADGYPDSVTNIAITNLNIWVFGKASTEIWNNAGIAGFPYESIPNVSQAIGLYSSRSLSTINDLVFFLGGNTQGIIKVYMGAGTQTKPISDIFIEQTFQSYAGLSDTVGWTYQDSGHIFYVLNFLQANKTWVYDVTTERWHQRSRGFDRWPYDYFVFSFGKNLVANFADGQIYQLNNQVYTDAGATIIRQRTAPHLSDDDSNNWLFFDRFELEAKFGNVPQGLAPKVMLQYSSDGGFNWGPWLIKEMGAVGQYSKIVDWNRLGRARSMVFRIRITDPVEVFILGAWIDAAAGKN